MSEYVCNEIEKSYFKQKRAVCFVFNKNNLTHSRPLFENCNALNAYQVSIHQHLNFMHKIISNEIPSIFSVPSILQTFHRHVIT